MSRRILTTPYLRLQTLTFSRRCGTKPDNPVKDPSKDLAVKEVDLSTRVERTRNITRGDLQWRTPWHEKEGVGYNFLRVMYNERSHTSVLKMLQTPIDFRPSTIKKWWAKKKEEHNIATQQYIPERNQILGNELAAAHFVAYRGGAVKFFNDDEWIKADQFGNYALPNFYEEGKVLQGIDCSGVNLYYEGLVNFRSLKKVEWFSVNGCENMDDWCIDMISNVFRRSLIYLDLRGCPNITHRGLGALCKMDQLKILYVDDNFLDSQYEMTCLMLEEVNPNLDIKCE